MKIRICNPNDKEAWIKMNQEFMASEIKDRGFWNEGENASYERFAQTFDQVMDHPDMATLLIAEDEEGEAIGFANLMSVLSVWSHGKALILDDIYLCRKCQGRGNGTQMLKYIEDYAQANGYKRLQFQSPSHYRGTREFYSKLGYKGKDMKFFVKYF